MWCFQYRVARPCGCFSLSGVKVIVYVLPQGIVNGARAVVCKHAQYPIGQNVWYAFINSIRGWERECPSSDVVRAVAFPSPSLSCVCFHTENVVCLFRPVSSLSSAFCFNTTISHDAMRQQHAVLARRTSMPTALGKEGSGPVPHPLTLQVSLDVDCCFAPRSAGHVTIAHAGDFCCTRLLCACVCDGLTWCV